KGEQPLRRAIDHSQQSRKALRRRKLEMRVHDRPERRRCREPWHKHRRDGGWNGENDGVARRQRCAILTEIERADPMVDEFDMPQLMMEAHAGSMAIEISEAGIDKGGPEPLHRDERAASIAALGQGFTQNRAGKK